MADPHATHTTSMRSRTSIHSDDQSLRSYHLSRASVHSSDEEEDEHGLQNGDVVAFAENGVPYAVCISDTESMRSSSSAEVFEFAPTHLEEGVSIADPSTHLVVIKQGRWLGFRSTSANGKLLQARKRGPSKLCFFNFNFGIFEQWETDDEPQGTGWSTTLMRLRNRRLPNFVLTVEVMKVPLSLQYSTLTPQADRVPTAPPPVEIRSQASQIDTPSPLGQGLGESGDVPPAEGPIPSAESPTRHATSSASWDQQPATGSLTVRSVKSQSKVSSSLVEKTSEEVIESRREHVHMTHTQGGEEEGQVGGHHLEELVVRKVHDVEEREIVEHNTEVHSHQHEVEVVHEHHVRRHPSSSSRSAGLWPASRSPRPSGFAGASTAKQAVYTTNDSEVVKEQDHVMRKMTGVLIKEWSQFVLKEVRARQEVEKQLELLVREMEFMRTETATEVRSICEEWRRELEALMSELNVYRRSEQNLKYLSLTKLLQQRRTRSAVSTSFHAWRARKDEFNRQAIIILKVESRWMSRMCAEWKRVCLESQRLRHAARCVVRRRETGTLERSLDTWKSVCAGRRRCKQVMRDVGDRVSMRVCRSVLGAWREVVFEGRERQEEELEEMQADRLQVLSSRFLAWVVWWEERDERRQLVNKNRISLALRRKTACFFEWRHWQVREKCLRAVLVKWVASQRARQQMQVLAAWWWVSLQRQRARRVVRWFLRRSRQRTLQFHLDAWTLHCSSARRRRQAVLRLVTRAQVRVKREVLQWWVSCVGGLRHRQVLYRRLAAQQRIHLLRCTLDSWRHLAATGRVRELVLERFHSTQARKTLMRVSESWREVVLILRDSREEEKEVIRQWTLKVIGSCFTCWVVWWEEIDERRRLVRKGLVRHWRGVLKQSLWGWWEVIRTRALLELTASKLKSRIRIQIQQSCCKGWVDQMHQSRCRRVLLQRAAEKNRARCCERVFGAWGSTAAMSAELTHRLTLLSKRVGQRQLAEVADSWREAVATARWRRALLQATERRRTWRTMQAVVSEWSWLCLYLRDAREEALALGLVVRQKEARECLRAWDTWALNRATFRAKVAHAIRHAQLRTCAMVLRGLHRWVLCTRRLRSLARTAHARLVRRTLQGCLHSWSGWAMSRRRVRVALQRHLAVREWALLADVVSSWQEVTRQARLERRDMGARELSAAQELLKRCLLEWAEESYRRSLMRARLQRAQIHMSHFRQVQRLHAWAQQCATARLHRTCEHRIRLRTQRSLLARVSWVWLAWAQEQRLLRRSQSRGLERMQFEMMSLAFTEWLEWMETRKERAALLARALALTRRRTLQAAWQVWWHSMFWVRARDRLEQRVRHRLERELVEISWATWLHTTQAHLRRLHQVNVCRYRSTRRQLASGFASWRALVEDMRWRVQVALVSEVRLLRTLQRSAFVAWSDYVVNVQLRSERLALLARRVERRTLASCFVSWEDHCHSTRALKRVMELAQQRRSARIATSSLAAWANHHAYMTHLARQLASALQRRTRDTLQRTLAHWAQYTRQRLALIGLERELTRRLTRCLARDLIQSWQVVVGSCYTRRLVLQRALARRTRTQLSRALSRWVEVAGARLEVRSRLRRLEGIQQRSMRGRCLRAWRDLMEERRESIAAMARWRRVAEWRCVGRVFYSWRDHVALRAFQERLASRLSSARRAALLQRAFSCLCNQTQYRRHVRIHREMLVARQHSRHMAKVLTAWRQWSAISRRMLHLNTVAYRMAARSALTWPLHRFCSNVAEAKHDRRMERRAGMFHKRRCELRVCQGWAAWTRYQNRIRRLALMMQARDRWRVKAATWHAWRHMAELDRSHLSEEDRLRAMWRHLNRWRRSRVFYRWQWHLLEKKRRLRVGVRVARAHTRRVVVSALHAWRIRALTKVVSRVKVTRVLKQVLRREMMQALQTWQSHAAQHRLERRLYAKVVRRWERSMHTQALAHWANTLRRTKIHRHAVQCARARSLRRAVGEAWGAWRAHCWEELHSRQIKELVFRAALKTRRCRSLARRSLQGWREHTLLTSRWRAILEKCQAQKAIRTMDWALQHWKKMVEEVSRRRETIKRCITTKRVTVHWFLQWYWEAYDIEISSSLKLLMGTCDDALTDLYTAHLPGKEQHALTSSHIFERWEEIGSSLQMLSLNKMPAVEHSAMLTGTTEQMRQSCTPVIENLRPLLQGRHEEVTTREEIIVDRNEIIEEETEVIHSVHKTISRRSHHGTVRH